MRTYLLSFLFFSLCAQTLLAQPCKEIVGYYPNWQWYDRNKLVKPTSIVYSKYTVINYCFFKPETSGLISSTDSWADENLLLGDHDWANGNNAYFPNTSIIDLAHNAGTKVMVSIGGWTLSDNFPAIAASATTRAIFAGECNRLLQLNNFDGIDIDWEYPGFADHSGTSTDKQNFTLFLQQIRDSISDLGLRTGKQYKLSACFSAASVHAADIEWNNVPQILDMVNVMSYDFFGAWDGVANHNSPLLACGAGDASFNLDAAFNMLTQTYAVSPSKINLGVAFYGRSQQGATALYQPTNSQPDNVTFSLDDGSPQYYNIVDKLSLFNTYWDNVAEVPYLLGNSGTAVGTFVSYDNEQSIGLKAQYIVDNNARGAIIWEITGDYLETAPGSGVVAGTPLLDTLYNTFCAAPLVSNVKEQKQINSFSIYPNPTNSNATVSIAIKEAGNYYLNVFDVFGKRIISKNYNLNPGINQINLSVSDLEVGCYYLKVEGKEMNTTGKFIINK